MGFYSRSFVEPLSRLLRDPRDAASRPSKDVQADNDEFRCKAASSTLRVSRRQVVTVTLRNGTVVIVPHPTVQPSLAALLAGIPASHGAGSRRPPAAYSWHASCSMAPLRLDLPPCDSTASPPPCGR